MPWLHLAILKFGKQIIFSPNVQNFTPPNKYAVLYNADLICTHGPPVCKITISRKKSVIFFNKKINNNTLFIHLYIFIPAVACNIQNFNINYLQLGAMYDTINFHKCLADTSSVFHASALLCNARKQCNSFVHKKTQL